MWAKESGESSLISLLLTNNLEKKGLKLLENIELL